MRFGERPKSSRDWLTESGSQVLARRITGYWAERGATVAAGVEYVGHSGPDKHGGGLWGIRSNLGLGLPEGATHA